MRKSVENRDFPSFNYQQRLRKAVRASGICRLRCNKIIGQTAQSNSDKSREEDKITCDLVDVVTEISERLLQIVPSAGLHHQGSELQMKH